MKQGIFFSILICAFLLFFIGCSSSGGGGGDVENDDGGGVGKGEDNVTIFWQEFGRPDFGLAKSVQQTADGGFIMAGYIGQVIGGPTDAFLIKTGDSGVLDWMKTFGGSGHEEGTCVLQTSDGGYIVGGYQDGTEGRVFYLIRTDADGEALAGWPKTYANNSRDGIYDLCEATEGDGFVFVGSSVSQHFLMAKVGHDGTLLWEKTFQGPGGGWDVAFPIDPSPDGGYIIAGCDGGGSQNVWVARTDALGNLKAGWPKAYGEGVPLSVKNTPDGGFVIAGNAPDAQGDMDAILIKANASGVQSWKKTFTGARNNELDSVDLTADGGIIAVGGTQSYSTVYDQAQLYLTYDIMMVRVDQSGNTLWQKVIGRTPDCLDAAKFVQNLSDGGFILAGGSNAYPMIAKMDRSGNTVSMGKREIKLTVSETSGTIGLGNASLIAGRGAGSLLFLQQLGAFGLDLLLDVLDDPSYEYCTTSGDSSISPSPGTVAEGDSYTVTMTACVTGSGEDRVEFDGSLGMEVESLDGTLALDGTYTVDLTYYPIDLSFVDDVGLTAIDGSLAFSRQAAGSDISELAEVSPSQPLYIDEDGVLMTITSCSLGITGAGDYALGIAGDTELFELEGISGTLTLNVVAPVVGTDPMTPDSGELFIEAADGSSVTVTVILGDVELSIDTDGDGSSDGTLSGTWDDLN
ncbi:MAG TPA: hypothetical protein PLB09_02160 [Deltaproteobacteria bacterium]|nr:hypothetical protein [Deltaproteobacteria bacterium]